MRAARQFIALCLRIVVIVLTNLASAGVILGCSVTTVHVVSTETAGFQELLNAETAAQARRPAHLMKAWVHGRSAELAGVLDDERLPEPYTLDIGSSIRPAEYHLGYAAERLIREHYSAGHSGYRGFENDELAELVHEAGGNLGMVHDFDRDRRIDIADIERRLIFEIVPPGQTNRAAAKKKIDFKLLLVNNAMLGVPTFSLGTTYSGEIGVRFAEGAAPWKLTWATTIPGVVQYQWQALRADEPTEDAYREAYLNHRWRALTSPEIIRFGRALHEVVERLVQAREELGRTRAASEMPILPGKTMGDYLRSVASWSAHDDDIARLLPVMRGPPVQVRRDARLLGETVNGGEGGDAQGVYVVKGKPGRMPDELFMGLAAHNIIGEEYKRRNPPRNNVRTNTVSILAIARVAGGTPALLRADEALLRPDITDLLTKVVFEVKSTRDGKLEEGKTEVAMYITAINRSMPPTLFKHGTGYSGDFWVRFDLGMRWWRLKWSTTAPGVVQYNWSKLDNDEVDEAKIKKGLQDGRFTWVDLTTADMQKYAEKCAVFSEMYVNGSEKLYLVQLMTDFVVGVIGNATIVWLSPGLGPGKTSQPGALPLPLRPTVTTPVSRPPIPVRPPTPTMRPPVRLPARPASPPPPP